MLAGPNTLLIICVALSMSLCTQAKEAKVLADMKALVDRTLGQQPNADGMDLTAGGLDAPTAK